MKGPIRALALLTLVVPTLISVEAEGDWLEVRRKVRNSVLFIEAVGQKNDGTKPLDIVRSTGFVISDNGFGMTVAHGVPRTTSETTVNYYASAGSRYASKFPIEVIRRDDDLDLAIFRLPPVQNWHLIGLGKSNDVPEDTRLYVLGFPRSSDLASAEGLLSSYFGPGGKWQTTLPLDYGNSGGPVFDARGRQQSDLDGDFAECKFKVPNPFYFIR